MKTFLEYLEEKTVSVLQRKKAARRMSKLQRSASFQAKKKRTALRIRDAGKLAVIARKKTIQMFRDKFYPTYKEMALAVGIDSEAENEAERPGEIERSSLNPSLAEKILGWKPQTSLREGVHSTLKWFESEREDNS